ncbi:MAG: hypothetical protein WC498_01510 [Candidatus Saccharimonadales bacterium]
MKQPLAIYSDIVWLGRQTDIEVRELEQRNIPESTLRGIAAMATDDLIITDEQLDRTADYLEHGKHYVAEEISAQRPTYEPLGIVSTSYMRYGARWERHQQLKFEGLYTQKRLRSYLSLVPEILVYSALKDHVKNSFPVYAEPGIVELERMNFPTKTYSYGRKKKTGIVPISDNPRQMMHYLEKSYPSVFRATS